MLTNHDAVNVVLSGTLALVAALEGKMAPEQARSILATHAPDLRSWAKKNRLDMAGFWRTVEHAPSRQTQCYGWLHQACKALGRCDKVKHDPDVTHTQLRLLRLVTRRTKNDPMVSIKITPDIVSLLPALGCERLTSTYRPKIEDQGPYIEELAFLVKKLAGEDRPFLTLEEEVRVRDSDPDRLKRYRQVRKEAMDVYKQTLQDLVRTRGETTIDVNDLLQELVTRKVVLHNIPAGFSGRLCERGRLHTSAGKEIIQCPSPGLPVVMNPIYDPVADETFVFTYIQPGEDKRPTLAYTVDYRRKAQERIFAKADAVYSQIPAARTKWLECLHHPHPSRFIYGLIMELLYEYQIRIGNPTNRTGGERTFGLTTLQVRHVRFLASGKVKLAYVAKSGMDQENVIRPSTDEARRVIELLRRLCDGKKRSEYVFALGNGRVSAAHVNAYIKEKLDLDITAKMFRTLKGTGMMRDLIKSKPLKKSADATFAAKFYKTLALEVGVQLGHKTAKGTHTAATAIRNYIAPDVSVSFFRDRGFRVPTFLSWADK